MTDDPGTAEPTPPDRPVDGQLTLDRPAEPPPPGATGGPSPRSARGRRRSDREIVLFALGLLAVAAILVLLPDLTPSGAQGLVSERIHARVVELQPPT